MAGTAAAAKRDYFPNGIIGRRNAVAGQFADVTCQLGPLGRRKDLLVSIAACRIDKKQAVSFGEVLQGPAGRGAGRRSIDRPGIIAPIALRIDVAELLLVDVADVEVITSGPATEV